jgi:hypothetical protein
MDGRATVVSPLLALSEHFQLHREFLLLGVKAEVARTHVEVRL